ncbi:putative membrane protein [Proteiniphilum saccharofermentans]|uniref:Putative membrane protein n=1 Tax=Proteiniphilum saccharofermentans TaxID=1642647 RepID=A0A1R3T786_9BACT|nr:MULTISPECIES: hypothetical protein [Proteiniphilum]SCD19805.1 putative membrane protein [Proteiniphilum saccharofermentans]SFK92263.1 hypothetical protein SAMN05216357_108120 [Porphyromonadaceae bacterium KH3CP3RA]
MNTIKGIILITSLIFFASCTFDYFEDETNYMIYAPKACAELRTDDYRIEDIHIYIYKEMLEKQKTACFPFQENPRMKMGYFNFRLYPGSYLSYCFADTEGLSFNDVESYRSAVFGLPESDNGEYHYPGSLTEFSVNVINSEIEYPAPIKTDTVLFNKRYSGRICIAFEKLTDINPLLTYNNISSIKIEATGVGTYQNLALLTDSIHTRSGRYTPSDKVMMECIPYENPLEGYLERYDFGIDGYFFPSLNDEEEGSSITLWMDFIDHDGNSIHAFPLGVSETLHMNQTIYIGTDGVSTVVLEIDGPEQWDPGIEHGDGGMGI